MPQPQSDVLYVYCCPACQHRGAVRLPDDSHDGEAGTCTACGGTVTLEWDGGVTLHPSNPTNTERS